MQTTFLYAHRALRRGVVPESESAWLYAIAKNVCSWQQRTILRRGPLAGDLDVDALASPQRFDAAESGLARELDEALAAIPERQRQAIVLREWRGLSCTEIASRLELSASATHALLTRARRSVASALSAAGRRSVLGLDFGSLFLQLKQLLAGAPAKVAVGTVIATGLGVGGVAVERGLDGDRPAARPPAPAVVGAAPRAAALAAARTAPRRTGVPPRLSRSHASTSTSGPDVYRPAGMAVATVVETDGPAASGTVSAGSTGEAGEARPSEAPYDLAQPASEPPLDLTLDLPLLPDLEAPTDVPSAGADLPPLPEPPTLPEVEASSLPAALPTAPAPLIP